MNILAQNIARETKVKIITWAGHCEVHERFTAAEIRELRKSHPGVVDAGASRMPAGGGGRGGLSPVPPPIWRISCATKKPARVALITECSMSDNIAQQNQSIEFVRPCNLCPHMKRITLKNIRAALETMQTEVLIDARHLRAGAPRGRANARG